MNPDFDIGVATGLMFGLLFGAVAFSILSGVVIPSVPIHIIHNTGEAFCESYGLSYDGFEKITVDEKTRIQFNCFNETEVKVDGIGKLVVGEGSK